MYRPIGAYQPELLSTNLEQHYHRHESVHHAMGPLVSKGNFYLWKFLCWHQGQYCYQQRRQYGHPVFHRLFGLFGHDDLNRDNTAIVQFHNLEGEVAIGNPLMLCRELTLDFQQQTRQGIGITLYLLEVIV